MQCVFIIRFSEIKTKRQAIAAIQYAKQKKYEPVEDYYDRFLWLCVLILQQPDDIYLKEAFWKGLQIKVKMAIINMLKKTLAKVVEFAIIIEEELPMK
jgi:hypothetical protein